MFQFDYQRLRHIIGEMKNSYEYLTNGMIQQKWMNLYEKTRITKIIHRFSDLKIEITGIKEKEFKIFNSLILTMFYIFHEYCTKNPKICDLESQMLGKSKKKKLRVLKEQDPVLYDFKKRYKSKVVYSKICQKPYQPLMLTPTEYNKLSKEAKENTVQYWNFTTESDVYYLCPNQSNPYVHFIIKKHPKNYGIPCCKKTSIPLDPDNPKRIIYDIILKEHEYEKEKRTITLGSRYIMRYGKDIEPNRLSKLPEASLDILFHESVTSSDISCNMEEGYYLYGVVQNTLNVNFVGYLYCLMSALESSLLDLIELFIYNLRQTPDKFNIILNGKIFKYFDNIEAFITALEIIYLVEESLPPSKSTKTSQKDTNLKNKQTNIIEMNPPWNDIFIQLSYLYLNINTIKFADPQNDGRVNLTLPNYLNASEDYFPTIHKHLIVLQKGNRFYPIYSLNIDVFFKTKLITNKLFTTGHDIIKTIEKMVKQSMELQKEERPILPHPTQYSNKNIALNEDLNHNFGVVNNRKFNLSIISEFLSESYISRKYTLSQLYINQSNVCYAVEILTISGKHRIYIPIHRSYYTIDTDIKLYYKPFIRSKNSVNIKILLNFIYHFNQWAKIKSKKNSLILSEKCKNPTSDICKFLNISPIIIEKWLCVAMLNFDCKTGNNIIGFQFSGLNFYCTNFPYQKAKKIKFEAPIVTLLYDPDIINKTIYSQALPSSDPSTENIGKNLYYYNLYQLLLIEFINYFSQDKNTTFRQKIKKIIVRYKKDPESILLHLISDLNITSPNDKNKLQMQIKNFMVSSMDIKAFYNTIDASKYEFDNTHIHQLKELPIDELIERLNKISIQKGIFNIVPDGYIKRMRNLDFPNIFLNCSGLKKNVLKEANYCKNGKLIIEKSMLKEYIQILAADLKNPLKEKWLFSELFSEKVMDFYKFKRRPFEHITVTTGNIGDIY
jgi:hypothetical protein